MHSAQQIERELIVGMRRIAVPYQKALQILRAHNVPADSATAVMTTPGTDISALLRPSMEMIADYESTLGPLRSEWNALEKDANGELKTLVDEQAGVLQELISLLDAVESQLAGSRSHLASRLDVSQRQNAMRQAYQA